jgi:adenosylhomocysteinase
VGNGLAKRLRALGSKVTICEVDAIAALQALHDGYHVAPLIEACQSADWIISASGVARTISAQALATAKDGAVIASAGGALNEIAIVEAIEDYKALFDVSDKDRCLLEIEGKTIVVLSGGHGINYTSGGGNPIEIMDLSFAGQLESLAYIIKNRGKLPNKVIPLPDEISISIAQIKLKSMSVRIDGRTGSASWRETRFNSLGG